MEYFKKRVVRLSATPHIIALGFAAGAFASCTPFVGLHFLLAFGLAFLVGGNLIAAAIGTAVGNPITFPFIWATTFKIGAFVLPETKSDFATEQLSHEFFTQSIDTVLPILARMLIGAVPCGVVVSVVSYFVIRSVASAYQQARRRRLQQASGLSVGAPATDGVQAVK